MENQNKTKQLTKKELEATIKQYEAIIEQYEKDLRKAKADLEHANEYGKELYKISSAAEVRGFELHGLLDEKKTYIYYMNKAFGISSLIVGVSAIALAILTSVFGASFAWALLGLAGGYFVLAISILIADKIAKGE